jgi:hypothetical protein
MGIDVYLKWDGQTEEEKQAQLTGCSIVHGHKGYLREAYHGGPYATRVLFRGIDLEHEDADGYVPVTAKQLEDNIKEAVFCTLIRELKVYGSQRQPAVVDIKETVGDQEQETVEEVIQAMAPMILGRLKEAMNQPLSWLDDIPEEMRQPAIMQMVLWAKHGWLPDFAQSFVDFVMLAKRKEAEGKALQVQFSS